MIRHAQALACYWINWRTWNQTPLHNDEIKIQTLFIDRSKFCRLFFFFIKIIVNYNYRYDDYYMFLLSILSSLFQVLEHSNSSDPKSSEILQ